MGNLSERGFWWIVWIKRIGEIESILLIPLITPNPPFRQTL
jgi:hypothetical protein